MWREGRRRAQTARTVPQRRADMPCAFVMVAHDWRRKSIQRGAPGAVAWARDRGPKTGQGGGDLHDDTYLRKPIYMRCILY